MREATIAAISRSDFTRVNFSDVKKDEAKERKPGCNYRDAVSLASTPHKLDFTPLSTLLTSI